MTQLTEKYEGSIAAGRALEGGLWAFALALGKNVQDNGGSAKEACEALKEAGVVSTSGEPYSERRIRQLVQIGTAAADRREFTSYPPERVCDAGIKHDWDAEAMLLTLQAGGTRHDIRGTSILGTVTSDILIREADRLPAKDRAALATALVAEPEVREAIMQSGPMAVEQHIELSGEIFRAVKDNSERRFKGANPALAARSAADEIGEAARHLNNALAEIIRWNVTAGDDRLRLVESAMVRVERAVSEINDSLDRVNA